MKRASPARNRRVTDESSIGSDDASSGSTSPSSSGTTSISDTRKRVPVVTNKSSSFPAARNAILSMGISFALWQIVSQSGPHRSSVISKRGLRSAPTASDDDVSNDFCTLYMAPSTLGPHAGFGIFTGKAFARDDPIKIMDGPSIAVVDPYVIPEAPHLRVLGDKWWGELKGMPNSMRFESESVMEYVAGFGSLPNFHPYLSNIDPREPKSAMDDTAWDRAKNAGAGSTSVYTGKDIFADRNILAGEELFLDYGESYFDESPDIFRDTPRENDYYDASSFMIKFKDEISRAKDGGHLTSKEEEIMAGMFRKMKGAVAKAYSSRSASLLPGSIEDLTNIADAAFNEIDADPLGINSGDEPDEGRVRFALAREMSTRHVSPSWLHTNGFCLDNIVHKPSTISGAGNGGFAARSLQAGEVIVPVPLYHVADRALLATYPIHIDSTRGKFLRNETRLNGPPQLLMNYCFGDDDSSLLLCPITSAMHLNHCSHGDRCGSNTSEGPNAKLRWATKWHPDTEKWLNSTVEEIEREKDRVLNLEVVATREIGANEEIFIDYGRKWEVEWERHKSKWAPQTDLPELHKSAVTLNRENAEPVPTNDLRNNFSAPGDVMMGCWYWPESDDDDDTSEDNDGDDDVSDASDEDTEDMIGNSVFRRRSALAAGNKNAWKSLSDEEILSQYAVDGSQFVDDENYVSPDFWPCSVITNDGGNKANATHTVRIFQSKSHHEAPWERESEPLFLTNYPRSSIRYFVKPYRSIQHSPSAFRRFIGLPNDMWPEKWKNRRDARHQGQYRVGDRVIFLSSSNKEKTGIVVHFDSTEGYDIFSMRSGKVRAGIAPEKIVKLDVRVKELDMDKIYV